MMVTGGMKMQFEWDDQKEKINLVKHGIDFSTAALVFQDENRIELYDESHSTTEDRYITMNPILPPRIGTSPSVRSTVLPLSSW